MKSLRIRNEYPLNNQNGFCGCFSLKVNLSTKVSNFVLILDLMRIYPVAVKELVPQLLLLVRAKYLLPIPAESLALRVQTSSPGSPQTSPKMGSEVILLICHNLYISNFHSPVKGSLVLP